MKETRKKQKHANLSYFGDEITEVIANSFGMRYDHLMFHKLCHILIPQGDFQSADL